MFRPTVRRLKDITKKEMLKRQIAQGQLGETPEIENCFTCKKPVWITCFFDGTGNNFFKDGNGLKDAKSVSYSNIAKLAKFAHPLEDSGARVYSLYAQGVGTPFAAIGDSGDGVDKATGMSSAWKGQARIDWMFKNLINVAKRHVPHISQLNIAVFGFSRGAAMARAFVRQVGEKCTLTARGLVWNESGPLFGTPVVVYFLGIFDTVASVGFGGSRLEGALSKPWIPGGSLLTLINDGGHAGWASDLRIPSFVKRCVHYVAAHEVREKFPSDSVREDQIVPGNCIEIFYPGAHSDVGGGYADMEQEDRYNQLAAIPLCNMYLEAYAAGVPLISPGRVESNAGALFDIGRDLEMCFETYMSTVDCTGRLENDVIAHMGSYYHWRWGRTERQRSVRKKTEELLRQGETVAYGLPDNYMKITDKEWEKDVQDIAEKKTGYIRQSTTPLEDVIFDAWKGTLRKKMGKDELKRFDEFFDRYVHDSVAGFKNQLSDAWLGSAEASRWARNRQYFLGKRDEKILGIKEEKFIYWRYEGKNPVIQKPRVAYLQDMPKKIEGGNTIV